MHIICLLILKKKILFKIIVKPRQEMEGAQIHGKYWSSLSDNPLTQEAVSFFSKEPSDLEDYARPCFIKLSPLLCKYNFQHKSLK